MVSNNKNEEPIFIQIGNEVIELIGKEKEAFIADQVQVKAKLDLRETEYKAKQKAREDAIKKLAEVAGLTEEEINSIL